MATIQCSQCKQTLAISHFTIIGSNDPRWIHGSIQFEEKCKMCTDPLDYDADFLAHSDLIAEVKRLRAGIRKHRDAQGHDLCWFHPELWNLLHDKVNPDPNPPPWSEFIQKCAIYRASLDKRHLPVVP